MEHTRRQLRQIRKLARVMLLIQQVSLWAAAMLTALVACGLIDYALRLPGWLRLVLGLALMMMGAWWIVSRVSKTIAFRPPLSLLALRVERLYPQLTGVLASSIEFVDDSPTTPGAPTPPPTAQALKQTSIQHTTQQLQGLSLYRLIAPKITLLRLLLLGGMGIACAGVVVAAPHTSRTAAWRWLAPLGQTQWPRRTSVRSLTSARAWPIDTPLRFSAQVDRGYYPGMRAWVVYRTVAPNGDKQPWQPLLMTLQGRGSVRDGKKPRDNQTQPTPTTPTQNLAGRFERLVDLAQSFPTLSAEPFPYAEYYFVAGDDQTQPQRLELVTRPTAQSVTVDTQPPAYAKGLIPDSHAALHQQPGEVVTSTALIGSRVDLHVRFNRPLQKPPSDWNRFLPGLAQPHYPIVKPTPDPDHQNTAAGISKSWVLDQTAQTAIHLTDHRGLTNLSERRYRFEALPDAMPVVSLTQPRTDETVLPTAVVELEAVAQDDIGVQALTLEAQTLAANSTDPPPSDWPRDSLAQATDRQTQLGLKHTLDLQPLGLQPGDQLLITAAVRDVFDLNGQQHDTVRSAPRRLEIIDVATLVTQIRTELAAVRQQAIRLEAQEAQAMQLDPDHATPTQQTITRHLNAQNAHANALVQRIERNRLNPDDAGQLPQLLSRVKQKLTQAQEASQHAETALDASKKQPRNTKHHRDQARANQQTVRDALNHLVSLLDLGRDALALQSKLQQLKAMQEALTQETHRFMPQTLGWSVDQLSKPERKKLTDLVERQRLIANLSDKLIQQMQATADALARQGTSPDDQASAQVLAEAASIARRQGLTRTLQQAAEKAQQNQLSDAGSDQRTALDTVEQMLKEMTDVQQRRQAILRRRLTQLAQVIRNLIQQQTAQLDLLQNAATTQGLDAPQDTLRRNTMMAANQARATPKTQDAGQSLDQATADQAAAITALRQSQPQPASAAQRQAIEDLNHALAIVEQLRQQARDEQLDQQRRQLQQAYEQLAQQQQELKQQTEPFLGLEQPARRQRAAIFNLSHHQADIQIAAKQLLQQVQQTLVFTYLHDRIDQDADHAVRHLRKANANQTVLDRQDRIATTLLQMAQALEKHKDQPDFANPQSGGGGGGGGASPTPVVPPMAELKLLRQIQHTLADQTRAMDQQPPQPHNHLESLQQLGRQQRDLAGLTQKLFDSVRNARQHQPPAP